MLEEILSTSTIRTVLFVKKNFLPGPSSRSSLWIEKNNFDNNQKNDNIDDDDDEKDNDSNNDRKSLPNTNFSSYILSASINDHYENSNFLMLGTNQTMFFPSLFDCQFSNCSSQFSFSPSSTTASLSSSSSLLIPTFLGIILFTITIWTILGNILVILAFVLNKTIRQGGMSNYLIINLAISDLLLGVAVLPFSASYSTFGIWYFGKYLCEFWLAIDVLCSTASIWSLLMIAFDRYIATNYPIRYRHHRHSIRLALSYICVAWFVSIAICLLPTLIFEKKIPMFLENENRTIYSSPTKFNSTSYQCELYKDLDFVLISSLLSFYIPLMIMIFLYVKVLYAIRQQSFKMNKKTHTPATTTTTLLVNTNHRTTTQMTVENVNGLHRCANLDDPSKSESLFRCCLKCGHRSKEKTADENHSTVNYSYRQFFRKQNRALSFSQNSLNTDDLPVNNDQSPNQAHHQQQLGRREITAEARVTRSLAIVIGCFVCCWFPFFTLYITRAVCSCLSFNAIEFFVWLGYSNSAINPVLYAILNKNFRVAFKNIFLSIKKICF